MKRGKAVRKSTGSKSTNKKEKVLEQLNLNHPLEKILLSIGVIVLLFMATSARLHDTSAFDTIDAKEYINSYKDLAVLEMHRSGIPASIILAQGIHESNSGKSTLAKLANNHFGIKCKSYWVGKTYFHKDDDYKNGKLIESCFRAYDSAVQSYVDHSNFLMTSKNYESLFKYDSFDYESWAHGLKRCGYATDPTYTNKLIKIIEELELYKFDYEENPLHTLSK